jgi:hypothetical protein
VSGITNSGVHGIAHDTLTRTQLYELRGQEPPAAANENGSASSSKRCRECGNTFERANAARYCSEKCRKRAARARAGTSPSTKDTSETLDDRIAELVDDGLALETRSTNGGIADGGANGGMRADAFGLGIADLVNVLAHADTPVAVTFEYANGVSVSVGRTDT